MMWFFGVFLAGVCWVGAQDVPVEYELWKENQECIGNDITDRPLRLELDVCAYDCSNEETCLAFVLEPRTGAVPRCFMKHRCDAFADKEGVNIYRKTTAREKDREPPFGYGQLVGDPDCPGDYRYFAHGGDDDLLGCSYRCDHEDSCIGLILDSATKTKQRCKGKVECSSLVASGQVFLKDGLESVPAAPLPDYVGEDIDTDFEVAPTVEPPVEPPVEDVDDPVDVTPPVAAAECKETPVGETYAGQLSMSRNGRTCQRWDSQVPNQHSYNDPSFFPDDTVEDAANYCRQATYGDQGPWCYNMGGDWDYCDVPLCELPATDCKTKKAGSDYMGRKAYNKDSRTCQRWDSQTPNAHTYTAEHFPDATVEDAVNYCRDLGYGGDAPWCYHASDDGWTYCDIPWCASTDCKYTQKGDEYAGTLSVNRAGHTCQRWDSDSPNQHDYDDPEEFPHDESVADAANYCRRADWGDDGPWCYHEDAGGWEYCDIRYCPADDCKRTQKGDEYVGTMSTNREGGTCQRWDSQSPNEHGYNTPELFPYDESVEAAANYCRRANWGDDGPWCYDMAGGWKSCDIPYC